jgi:hypothetical protein
LPILLRLLSPSLSLLSFYAFETHPTADKLVDEIDRNHRLSVPSSVSLFLSAGETFAMETMEIFAKLRKIDQFFDIVFTFLHPGDLVRCSLFLFHVALF